MHQWLKSKYDLSDPKLISAIDDLPLWSAPFGLKLLEMVRLKSNITVLDIGSGSGFPIIELSQRLGDTCKVYGVDFWPEAVERSRMKIENWDITNLEIIEGQAEKLSFNDKYFDLIVSNNGINNVKDDKLVIKEISRVAKPGAQFVFTVNLPDTMIEFYDIFKKVLKDYNKKIEIQKLEDHIFIKRKPIEYIKKLLETNDFKINNIHEDVFYLRYANGSVMLNHFLIKLSFLEDWTGLLQSQDVNPIFALVEKKLNDLASEKGELRLTVPWVCFDCEKE
ncbi:MAG: methyltransferase domain-containing protein [Calditrichaceae bacterium]|nr:methyltransferase domain-containing protein [Calditrichaceae bacterium]